MTRKTIPITPDWIEEPNELSLCILRGHMMYPDDSSLRRSAIDRMVTDTLRERIADDTLREHIDDLKLPESTWRELVKAASDAMSREEALKQFPARQYDGAIVGLMVCALLNLDKSNHPKMTKREAQALVRRRMAGKGGRTIDIRRFDEIWLRMRPVAHLWAAHMRSDGVFVPAGFPCTVEQLPAFVPSAELILHEGATHRLGGGGAMLLDPDSAWRLELPVGDQTTNTLH